VTSFDVQLNAGNLADGFTFVLQNNSNTFIGGGGGGVGYNGIGSQAVAIGFDTWQDHSSTGLFLGDAGGGPGNNDQLNDPAIQGLQNAGLNLNQGDSGVSLSIGHNLRATIAYDGTNLYEQVIDLDDARRTVFQYNYGAVNLAQQLGGSEAWVGFTAATGGTSESVDIKNWVYSAGHVDPPPPPTFTLDDGSVQRSRIRSFKFTFDSSVTLSSGAAKLLKLNQDANGAVTAGSADVSAVLNAPTTADGGMTWTWTFTAGGSDSGSLVDGVYQVVLDHTKVSIGGSQPFLSDLTTSEFHRLFGDLNGNKAVNNQDFATFRTSFLKGTGDPAFVAVFDFDGNGTVNNFDFGQFRSRFLKSYTYP
jgi:hypothetical protein